MTQQGWQGQPPPAGWPPQPGPPPRPARRGGTVAIAVVTVVVGLLCAVGVVFLIFGDVFDEMAALLGPAGPSGPGGTMDLGHEVAVTVPDGWAVERPSGGAESAKARRGRSMVLGNTDPGRRSGPAELCEAHARSMAGHGITDATFTDATVVKSAGGALAVQCEVTGTATGDFGSGPIGIRYFVARSEADLTARLTLHYRPGSTREETLRDFTAMTDSLWESLLD